MSLKTAAELICAHGPIRKFHKVYSGPGYPVDPKREIERMEFIPIDMPRPRALPDLRQVAWIYQ